MGVLNVTPDSFSDGGRFGEGSRVAPETFRPDVEIVLAAARQMVADGAAVLDVGAVSTRPFAVPVSADEEWARLAPVLAPLRAAVGVPLSLDTTNAAVLARALEVGIDLVNDVSALSDDPHMAGLVSECGLPVVLMHRRGIPQTMQVAPRYIDVPREVRDELLATVARAEAAGIARERLLLDPGIGFGKRVEDNVALLATLPDFVATARDLGLRTVLGCSRKAFLGALIGRPDAPRDVHEREHATTATTVLAALAGVDCVRVHDVRAAADALAVVRVVHAAATPGSPTAPSLRSTPPATRDA